MFVVTEQTPLPLGTGGECRCKDLQILSFQLVDLMRRPLSPVHEDEISSAWSVRNGPVAFPAANGIVFRQWRKSSAVTSTRSVWPKPFE